MIDNEYREWLSEFQYEHWPYWAELPEFDLYMDQVLTYVNKLMAPFSETEITAGMINNYVKQHLVLPPKKRKYGRDQLGVILILSFLKSAYPLDLIRRGINLFLTNGLPQEGYDLFVKLLNDNIQIVAVHPQMMEQGIQPVLPSDEQIQSTAIWTVLQQTTTRKMIILREEIDND